MGCDFPIILRKSLLRISVDPLSPKLAYLAEFLCQYASTNSNHDKNHKNTRYDPHLLLCPRFGTGSSNQIHHWPLHGDLLGHCPGTYPDGTGRNCILLERRPMKTNQNLWHDLFDACVSQLENAATQLDPYWPGGMDYCKLNVILFCIVLPIVLGLSLALNAYLLHHLL